jgi:hypothetical protein
MDIYIYASVVSLFEKLFNFSSGLLRCGKSCRLRWINYLRPDIKRGNFSNEEEETIIKLHQILGNRYVFLSSPFLFCIISLLSYLMTSCDYDNDFFLNVLI